uniref:CCHC-type domain-containing protein n=1 Tax=Cacopsylla melanoneura TaxID=428564 RepID=A0A8D9BCG5_9HEMI
MNNNQIQPQPNPNPNQKPNLKTIQIQNYKPNYADKINTPIKEQAIIIQAGENLTQADYTLRVIEITGDSKVITHAAKISRNRIRIFFKSQEIAEDFVMNNPSINIKGVDLPTRMYVTTDKRLYISGACPSIPNDYINQCLKQIGINTTSTIQHMKAFHNVENLNHILSDKRSTTYKPEPDTELPHTILIKYEETEYLIYLETDNCRKCRKPGHTTANCPEILMNDTNTTEIQQEMEVHAEDPALKTQQQATNAETIQPNQETLEPTQLHEQLKQNGPQIDHQAYVTRCYEDNLEALTANSNSITTSGEHEEEEIKDKPATQHENQKLGHVENMPMTKNETQHTSTKEKSKDKPSENKSETQHQQTSTKNKNKLTINTSNLNLSKETIISPKRKSSIIQNPTTTIPKKKK